MFAAKLFAHLAGRAFNIGPNLRAQAGNFRQRIGRGPDAKRDDAADATDGAQKIIPFRQRKLGRLAGLLFQHGIRPEQHGQFAELGGLFQKTQVP